MCPRVQRILLALNINQTLGRTFFKMQCQKSPFLLHQILSLLSKISLAYALEITIFERGYSNLRHCKLEQFLEMDTNAQRLLKMKKYIF